MVNLKLNELAELFELLARYNDELIEDIYHQSDDDTIKVQVAIATAKDIIRDDIEYRVNNL